MPIEKSEVVLSGFGVEGRVTGSRSAEKMKSENLKLELEARLVGMR